MVTVPACRHSLNYTIRTRSKFIPLLSLLLIFAFPGYTQETITLSTSLLQKTETKYGPGAKQRLLQWETLIKESSDLDEQNKLNIVNDFFNRLTFVADRLHWNKPDYWATPVEFLASGGGDCEDFSIAKYFTLKALGLPEQKLNITYVKAVNLNQAHMVLTYYSTPDAEPLILDNIKKNILPARKRPDLIPVYTFNGSSLWIAKQRGKGKILGRSDRLSKWQSLLSRMTLDNNQ